MGTYKGLGFCGRRIGLKSTLKATVYILYPIFMGISNCVVGMGFM